MFPSVYFPPTYFNLRYWQRGLPTPPPVVAGGPKFISAYRSMVFASPRRSMTFISHEAPMILTSQDKYGAEVLTYTFDFTRRVEVVDGGTLSAPVFATVRSGGTITTPLVFANASISGGLVSVDISGGSAEVAGGTAGQAYEISCTCTLTGGKTIRCDGVLIVY